MFQTPTVLYEPQEEPYLQNTVARLIWGFLKFKGTPFGVPMISVKVFWSLHWGPLILGNYHIRKTEWTSKQQRSSIGRQV